MIQPFDYQNRRVILNNLKLWTAGVLGMALLLPLGAQANKPVGITGDTSDNDEAAAVAGIEAAGLTAQVD